MSVSAGPIARLLRERVDPVLERVMAQFVRLDLRDPIRWGLADHRRGAMRRAAAEFAPRAAALSDAVVRREPAAVARYDALIAEAIERMRSDRQATLIDAIERPLFRNVE